MVTLDRIRGQDRVVGLLRRAMAQGRVPHAYLFCGPAGSGKTSCALALAAAMNCDRARGEGCGECDSCIKIAEGNHPDVQILERTGAARIIPIETIRRQVIPSLAMAPHEGAARVFIVEEATSLAGPSANALLKTLEEPPPRTHFVLATTAPDQLLPTIRSRCQRINFAALAPDLRALLDDDADTAAHLGELVDRLARAAAAGDPASWSQAAAEVAASKDDVLPAMQMLMARLHQQARAAAEAGDLATASALGRRAMTVLDIERGVVLHNAHGQLALESMLYRLNR